MNNHYHRCITVPVDFKSTLIFNQSNYQEIPFDKKSINSEFNDWLESLGLEIGNDSRFFNSLPSQIYKMHIDKKLSSSHRDCVKLNMIFDSYQTVMNWYQLFPGKSGHEELNKIGHPLIRYRSDDVSLIYSAEVNRPCIINAMIIHDLINGDNLGMTRKSYSMPLIDIKSGTRITWKEAENRFEGYFG
jgi:hypothetical protein